MANNQATTGIDTIVQTPGNDTLTVTDTSQIQPEDLFDGGGGTDVIAIGVSAIDLSGAGTDATHGFHNYEGLTFIDVKAQSIVLLDAAQFGAGLISNTLTVTGTAASQIILIDNATIFSGASWSFIGWDSTSDFVLIEGTPGSDTITGTSAQDIIVDFVGSDSVDGGGGTDQLFLNATSGDLNAAADNRLVNVEQVSASGAVSAVEINLANQNEGFSIGGSSQADTLTGGSGNDYVQGFDGNDRMSGGAATTR